MRHTGNGKLGAWGAKGRGELRPDVRSDVRSSNVDSVGEEVAHARARFAVDPSTPARLADAWSAPTGTTEEDESELIDAVADCLSVGLPIDAAVASWRSGALQVIDRDDDDDDETGVFGDDDDTGVYESTPTSGRRRIVET